MIFYYENHVFLLGFLRGIDDVNFVFQLIFYLIIIIITSIKLVASSAENRLDYSILFFYEQHFQT